MKTNLVSSMFYVCEKISFAVKSVDAVVSWIGSVALNPFSTRLNLLLMLLSSALLTTLYPVVGTLIIIALVGSLIADRRKNDVHDVMVPIDSSIKAHGANTLVLRDYEISDLVYRCKWLMTQHRGLTDYTVVELIGSSGYGLCECIVQSANEMYSIRNKKGLRLDRVAYIHVNEMSTMIHQCMKYRDVEALPVNRGIGNV